MCLFYLLLPLFSIYTALPAVTVEVATFIKILLK